MKYDKIVLSRIPITESVETRMCLCQNQLSLFLESLFEDRNWKFHSHMHITCSIYFSYSEIPLKASTYQISCILFECMNF